MSQPQGKTTGNNSCSSMKLNDEKNKCVTLILSGASGTGKTTICRRLLEKLPNLKFTVSHTTRPRRSTDVGGRDYFFISESEFEDMKIRGEFLEWATINDYSYGTSFDSIKKSQDNSEVLIIELDVQGVESLHKIDFDGVYVFILPPSLEELEARLRNRKTETEEKIKQRLKRGKEEIKGCLAYDYILTNYAIEDSVDSIISIVNGKGDKYKASNFVPESPGIKALLNYTEKD
jgi:guanylate kinase